MSCGAWAFEEDAFIREMLRRGRTVRAIARAMGRTEAVVRTRAEALGLKVPDPRADALYALWERAEAVVRGS